MPSRASPEDLCRLLGLRHPIIQAPMAGVQGHELAAAASRAGALGSLPSATFSAEVLEAELQALTAALGARDGPGTALPWALNFFCHRPTDAQALQAEAAWCKAVTPWARQAGLPPPASAGAARAPFSAALADLIEPFRPPVVSFHFGLPAPDLLARVQAWGAKVLSSATTVEEAVWLQANGADAVIAQGWEAGGHRGHFLKPDLDLSGQAGLFALLPRIVAAVHIPVIAAGAIVNAASVRAALALGAAGVQAGTAFLCCPEARTSAVHRAALAGALPGVESDTAVTAAFTGRPARALVNRWVRESAAVQVHIPPFPLAAGALAGLRQAAEAAGQGDFSPLWAGQNTRACRTVPAAEVVRELAGGLNPSSTSRSLEPCA
ncbi:MAG: nitronate monooxygenase family protein [Rubrivivax sp.]|jgi:nitronate monooxygenase|nr:nitronate monooxygenase family protein [Rubrivivax sp.]